MRPLVYIKSGFLCEALEADVALVGALAGVRPVVDLEVLLAGEGGWALQALEGPALHCGASVRSTSATRRGTVAVALVAHISFIRPYGGVERRSCTYLSGCVCGC
ncbi:hypothetical protein EVAR_13364_1 [Eumeta japonica]|uniref:Uncharacterized protein n=1 Tax=Eumeta variegata TaxID=151549 RepID=A0A4C1TRX7_EUMVA|nr:hypothetical protein EVAR_13364_1 [Eumeta japonica]